jgi:hypothetical protein
MSLILVSSIRKGYCLKIGFPKGTAYLEINHQREHLNRPYLLIKYFAAGSMDKTYAGYHIQGWVFGIQDTTITTAKMLNMLHQLGFCISAHTLREEILNGYQEEEKEEENLGISA